MRYAAILLLGCLLLGTNSCKKGCTNPKAFNYDSGAKEDDASCQFCDSTVLDSYVSSTSITDDNSSGPYPFQQVLIISLQGNLLRYAGNACKRLGIEIGDCSSVGSFDAFARIGTVLYNSTNDTMIVTGFFRVDVSGSPTSSNQIFIDALTIPPLSSQKIENNVSVNCVQTPFAQANIFSQSFNFQYR